MKAIFPVFLKEFSFAKELLEEGEIITRLEGAPLKCGLSNSSQLVKGNLLAVGEAIGTTYPFTGEGIGKAMESGLLAAEVIDEALQSGDSSRLGKYADMLFSRLSPRYESYKTAEKWLSRRWLNDFVARRISRSPFLQERLCDFMKEIDDPRAVFDIRSLLWSYLK